MLFFDSRRPCVLLLQLVIAGCGSAPAESEEGGSTGTSQSCDPTAFECPAGTFCQAADACGSGKCVEQPPACNGACDGVCGCDGAYYCNACIAHRSGVDVADLAICSPPPPAYAASSYGLKNYQVVLTKTDIARDRCIRITLDKGEDEGLSFELGVMDPWRLREIIATDHALDCDGPSSGCGDPLALQGEVAPVVSAAGSIVIGELEGTVAPNVDVDLVLKFDQPWMGDEEPFAPESLSVNGPCL